MFLRESHTLTLLQLDEIITEFLAKYCFTANEFNQKLANKKKQKNLKFIRNRIKNINIGFTRFSRFGFESTNK